MIPAVLAIDGGNSKTDVALVSQSGQPFAHVRGAGSSPHQLGVDGSAALLDDLVAQVATQVGLGSQVNCAEYANVYLAGVDIPAESVWIRAAVVARRWSPQVVVDNDTIALLTAGTDAPNAVAVVCGAGINCLGVSAGGAEVEGRRSRRLVHARVDVPDVRFGGYAFPLPRGAPLRWTGDVILGIRPSAFSEDAGNGLPGMEVDVPMVEELGSEVHLLFNVDARAALTDVAAATTGDEAEALEPSLLFSDQGSTPFTAVVSASSLTRPGDRVRLTVDPDQFHFFDPASGNAIIAGQGTR